jgi:uncharacterized membrane protein
MSIYVTLLFICIIFIILDIPYLALFGQKWSSIVENIQSSPLTVHPGAAVVVYVLLALGLYNLVLTRDIDNKTTVLYSALLGITTYGVFNFTNMAIFDKYDVNVALIDTAWGGILTASVGYLAKIYLM